MPRRTTQTDTAASRTRLASAPLAAVLLLACSSSASGPAPDTTRPRVLSISPAAGTSLQPPDVSISATFSEPVDCTTVNASSFELFEGSQPIPGDVLVAGYAAAALDGQATAGGGDAFLVKFQSDGRQR